MCTGIECQNHHQPHSCIHRVPVFQQLTEEDMRSVQAITLSRAYRKGSYIFRAGECSDSLFVVNEGLVKLSTTSEDGREHVIRFLFPGDFFGQLALLQNKTHYATPKSWMTLPSAASVEMSLSLFRNGTRAWRFPF